MPKHMMFPKTCEECPITCDEPFVCLYDDFDVDVGCPLIVTDADGRIDWNANGWPNPNPHRAGDGLFKMPYGVLCCWYTFCDNMRWQGTT